MAASILVVEDDHLARNLICWFLRKEEYEVMEAGDGAEALELLKARRFDLVISDFVMPKLDGLKLVEHLHAVSPRTPIIFTTGYLSRDSGQKILQDMAALYSEADRFRASAQLREARPLPRPRAGSVRRGRLRHAPGASVRITARLELDLPDTD